MKTRTIKTQSITRVRNRDRLFFWELARRGFVYYLRSNILFAAGCAVSAAVLCGALLTGGSLRQSIRELHQPRLGGVRWAVVSPSGYFRASIADSVSARLPVNTAPIMITAGSAGTVGGNKSVHRVNIIGADERFWTFGPAGTRREDLDGIFGGESGDIAAVVNTALAKKLDISVGGEIILRFQTTSGIARDAPFGARDDAPVIRLRVAAIAAPEQFGDFSLKPEHFLLYNVFVPLKLLQSMNDAQELASAVLIGGRPDDNSDKRPDERTNLTLEDIRRVVQNSLGPRDAGLNIRTLTTNSSDREEVSDPESDAPVSDTASARHADFEIYSDRVFIGAPLINAITGVIPEAIPVSAWFVNSISTTTASTPYSFVSTPPVVTAYPLADDHIELTAWTARDLGATTGDTVTLTYYVPKFPSGLRSDTALFIVSTIHPDTVPWIDRSLMPPYPGLKDAGSCSNWDPSVPVDLSKIRDKDEEYWARYEGTPKAIITYGRAARIWDNRFGVTTAIRVPYGARVSGGSGRILSFDDFERIAAAPLTPELCGMRLSDVRADIDRAINSGTDFAPLFLGLSFFTFAASLLLVWLLSALRLKSRADEIKILRTTGYSRKHILSIYLTEGMITFAVGTAAGILLSPAYTLIIIGGLKTVWSAAAQMPSLTLHIGLRPLLIGGAAAFVCAMIAMLMPVWGALKKTTAARCGSKSKPCPPTARCSKAIKTAAEHKWIKVLLAKLELSDFSMRRLAVSGALRDRKKFLGEAGILACALFILGITQMFHRHALVDPRDAASGAGGFVYYGEFNHGVPSDQTDAVFLRERGVSVNENDNDYLPLVMRMREGDDASCLNINKAQTPALLSVDQKRLDELGAFSFASVVKGADKKHPWRILGASTGDENTIYGIVDANTLEWGIGRSVGDTLAYINDAGDTLSIVIGAALKRSALQGMVIIGEEDFVRHYPSISGYRAILIKTSPEHEQAVKEAFQRFHDKNGLNLESTVERIGAFNAVENAYLSIFAILGILGLTLGCAGMGIVVLRDIEERRGELALLMVQGFGGAKIKQLLFMEHAIIAIAGITAGLLPSLVVSITAFNTASLLRILCLLTIVLSCGAVSILTGLRMFRERDILTALKEDCS